MKVGILTGGGDCPGLNAVIRAAVRKGSFHYEDQFVGFLEGWRGLMENKTMPLDLQSVAGILPRGGTILRTSRTNPAKKPDGLDTCIATLKKNGVDALIAIGDRKSTRLNSSHSQISYAVFCLKKKKETEKTGQAHDKNRYMSRNG